MLKKTVVLTAVAALAAPGAALAHKGETAHTHSKSHQAGKTKKVGFMLAGTELAGLEETGAGTVAADAFTLDLTSANRHARAFLTQTNTGTTFDKAYIAGDHTTEIPADGNGFKLAFRGVTDSADAGSDVTVADVLATDRVKVIGKVERTRNARTATSKGKPSFTYGALDIRKVVITRRSAE